MYTSTSLANKKINQYLVNDISNARPDQLIMKVYDFAISNCQRHDMIKTNEALQVLINSLDFDNDAAKGVSFGLFRLYQFCQDQMRKKNYDVVYKILTELKQSWQLAIQNRQ